MTRVAYIVDPIQVELSQGIGLIFSRCLCIDMYQGVLTIGQDQSPAFVMKNLNPVDKVPLSFCSTLQ